jgi:ribosome assembly protein 3
LQNDPHATTYENYYLRKATAEFAGDIDKVRSASDFNDKSVAILIDAIRQGVTAIPLEERRRVASIGKR